MLELIIWTFEFIDVDFGYMNGDIPKTHEIDEGKKSIDLIELHQTIVNVDVIYTKHKCCALYRE